MLIALWVVNVLLAVAMLGAGTMKLIKSREDLLAAGMAWVQDAAPAAIKAVGGIEILGAIGLIAPLATGIAPILTPLAAVGLAVVMLGAVALHVRRKESIVPALPLAVVAVASAVLGFIVL